MYCPTPSLPKDIMAKYTLLRRSAELLTAQIGFIMDNVTTVKDLSHLGIALQYFPDPVVQMFDPKKSEYDNVKVFKSEILIINVSIMEIFL